MLTTTNSLIKRSESKIMLSSMKDLAASPLLLYKQFKKAKQDPEIKLLNEKMAKEQVVAKHFSNLNLVKFKKLVNLDRLSLDICLEIWKLVISDINDMNQIISLLGFIPQLDHFILSIVANRFKISYNTNKTKKQPQGYAISVDKPDASAIHGSQLKVLIDYMKRKHMNFKTLVIELDLYDYLLPFAEAVRGQEVLTKMIQMTDKIELEACTLTGSCSGVDWLSKVTLFKTDIKFFNAEVLESMINLKKIIIFAHELLLSDTVDTIIDILENPNHNLEDLIIEYELLSRLSSSDDKDDICMKLAKQSKLHNEINLEFRPKLKNQKCTFTDNWIECSQTLKPIRHLFKSIQLGLNTNDAEESSVMLGDFHNLSEVTIFRFFSPQVIFLKSDSLKRLSLNWNSCLSSQPINLDFSGLKQLKYLCLSNDRFGTTTLKTIPNSVRVLHLENAEIEGMLPIPKNLMILKLQNSYPKIDCLRRSRHCALGLTLQLWNMNEKTMDIINQLSTVVYKITFLKDPEEDITSLSSNNNKSQRGPPTELFSIANINQSRRINFRAQHRKPKECFSLEYSDRLKRYDGKIILVKKSSYIDISNDRTSLFSRNEILKKLVGASWNSFVTTLNDDLQESFSDILVGLLKEQNLWKFKFTLMDSRMDFIPYDKPQGRLSRSLDNLDSKLQKSLDKNHKRLSHLGSRLTRQRGNR